MDIFPLNILQRDIYFCDYFSIMRMSIQHYPEWEA